MAISLPDDTKKDLVRAIIQYFRDERDEDIGELQASFILEFVLREVGPSIYNQAIRDAQAALQGTVNDLDVNLHEPEFGYSTRR